jgi:hypothetical protein
MWHALKQMLFWGLLIAAAGVVAVTALGDHESDYGSVNVPPGGTVELPKGTVKIFYEDGAALGNQLAVPIRFEVLPAAGGTPLTQKSTTGSSTGVGTQRSEDVISRGSVAELDVPSEGDYVVRGGLGAGPGVLSFGTDPFTAVTRKWRLLLGLLGAGLLVSLLPAPRTRRTSDHAWAAGA